MGMGMMKREAAKIPFGIARQAIKDARHAAEAAARLRNRTGMRLRVAEAAVLAGEVCNRPEFADQFDRAARLHRIDEIRSTGSPHLRVVRFIFGNDVKPGTAKRYADVAEVCHRRRWSAAKIRRRISSDGPSEILRRFPLNPRISHGRRHLPRRNHVSGWENQK
jgi:hypothetical protein